MISEMAFIIWSLGKRLFKDDENNVLSNSLEKAEFLALIMHVKWQSMNESFKAGL